MSASGNTARSSEQKLWQAIWEAYAKRPSADAWRHDLDAAKLGGLVYARAPNLLTIFIASRETEGWARWREDGSFAGWTQVGSWAAITDVTMPDASGQQHSGFAYASATQRR